MIYKADIYDCNAVFGAFDTKTVKMLSVGSSKKEEKAVVGMMYDRLKKLEEKKNGRT